MFCLYFSSTTIYTYFKWNLIEKYPANTQVFEAYKNLINTAKIGKYDLVLKFDLLKTEVSEQDSKQNIYFESAINQTQKLLGSYPNHPILLSQLGLLQMQSGDLKSAISTYENLKNISPNRHINLMDLGIMYLQNSEFDKAIKIFDAIYTMDKNYEPALINKAYCFLQKQDSLSCRQLIERVSIKTIVENFNKVADIYEKLSKTEVLLSRIEKATTDEKCGVFLPSTFKNWLLLAIKLKNNASIRRSIFECLDVYKIIYDKQEVEQIVSGIQQNKHSANVFFERYESKIVK